MKTRKFAHFVIRKAFVFTSVIVLSMLTLTSCYTYESISAYIGISESELREVPLAAAFVVIEKENTTAENLYYEINRVLEIREHQLDMKNDALTMLTTRGKFVKKNNNNRRKNDIKQRMEIRVRDTAFGARAVISTQHKWVARKSYAWRRTNWDGGIMRVAFAESIIVAKSIPSVQVSYERIDPFELWDSQVPRVQTVEPF